MTLNPEWLYQDVNYSAVKSRAIRLGYRFSITQKEYTGMAVECWHGHGDRLQGYRLLLDLLDYSDAEQFSVGNTIFTCVRHLGHKNLDMACANTKDIVDHARYVRKQRK